MIARASPIESEWKVSVPSPQRAPLLDDALRDAWQQRERDLLAIRRLRPNWDFDGAKAPDPRLADSAIELLRAFRSRGQMPAPSRITPTADGTIIMEWFDSRTYRMAEILTPQTAEWMDRPPSGPTTHGEYDIEALCMSLIVPV